MATFSFANVFRDESKVHNGAKLYKDDFCHFSAPKEIESEMQGICGVSLNISTRRGWYKQTPN